MLMSNFHKIHEIESNNLSLHLTSFGYLIRSHLSTFSRSILRSFLFNCVKHYLKPQLAMGHHKNYFITYLSGQSLQLRIPSIRYHHSQTESGFIRRLVINTMNRPKIRKVARGNGRDSPSLCK